MTTPRLHRISMTVDEAGLAFIEESAGHNEYPEVFTVRTVVDEDEGAYCWGCHGTFPEGECIPCETCHKTFCPDCEQNDCPASSSIVGEWHKVAGRTLAERMDGVAKRLSMLVEHWTEHYKDDPSIFGTVKYDDGYHDALRSMLDWCGDNDDETSRRLLHEVEAYLDNVHDWIKEVPNA